MTLHPTIETVTQRIVERSRPSRVAYLELIARERDWGWTGPLCPAETSRTASRLRARTKHQSATARP